MALGQLVHNIKNCSLHLLIAVLAQEVRDKWVVPHTVMLQGVPVSIMPEALRSYTVIRIPRTRMGKAPAHWSEGFRG